MKHVIWLEQEQFARWDAFVQKHPLGLIYHLSGWKRVLEKSFSHIRGYFLAIEDDESAEIIAGIPIYVVKSWLTGNRLVSIPFATLCDPLISSPSDMEIIWSALADLYEKIGARYIELRAWSFASFDNDSRFAAPGLHKHHYLILDRQPEEIKKSFNRNCRRNILKAVESPLKLKVAKTENELRDFYFLYLQTRRRLGLPAIPLKFFQALWQVFFSQENVTLLIAQHSGTSVAALLILKFKNLVIGEAIGDSTEYRKYRSSHFLFWNAITLSYKEGYRKYSFGRTSVQNQGLLSFKRGWGTVEETLADTFYPREICQEMERREFSWRYKAVKKIAEGTPNYLFPLFGTIVYRHMG